MRPLDYPLLADENIHPRVVTGLRQEGRDIVSVAELGLIGRPDAEVFERARIDRRVILTHDRDFGALVLSADQPPVGIIHLRPGHIDPEFTKQILDAIGASAHEVREPFQLVAERKGSEVRIRLRTAPLR